MKKICKTCTNWKRYIKLENNCLCIAHSRGNTDIYTASLDSCELWMEWKHNFKKFRDSVKPKIKIL